MIDFKIENLQQITQVLDPQLLKKAQTSALTRTRAKAVTQISKLARAKYNVSAGTVRDAIARRTGLKLSQDKTTAYIYYVGRRIGLINFAGQFKTVNTAAGKRIGATAKLYKNKSRYLTQRGFIAQGAKSNTHIYHRQEKDQAKRLPLNALYGPSIPQMVGGKEILRSVGEFVKEDFPIEMMRQIEYQLSRK